MQKTVKMTLKGKTFRKWLNEQNIYEVEKEIKPRGFLTLYIYMTFIFKQVYLYKKCIYLRSQVSVYRTIGSLFFLMKFLIFTAEKFSIYCMGKFL